MNSSMNKPLASGVTSTTSAAAIAPHPASARRRTARVLALATVLAITALLGAHAPLVQAADATKAEPAADRKFMLDAAKGGMAEVALGQMAQEKSSSDAVKKFGSRMVDDHGKANDELKQLASAKGVTLPTAPTPDANMRRLQGLSGAAFDRAYISHMVSDHHMDIAAFQKESKSGRDADVKTFATKTLPTLQEHLTLAEQTQGEVRRSGTAKPMSGSMGKPASGAGQ